MSRRWRRWAGPRTAGPEVALVPVARQLTEGDFDHSSPVVAGESVIVVSARHEGRDADLRADLYRIDLATGGATVLTDPEAIGTKLATGSPVVLWDDLWFLGTDLGPTGRDHVATNARRLADARRRRTRRPADPNRPASTSSTWRPIPPTASCWRSWPNGVPASRSPSPRTAAGCGWGPPAEASVTEIAGAGGHVVGAGADSVQPRRGCRPGRGTPPVDRLRRPAAGGGHAAPGPGTDRDQSGRRRGARLGGAARGRGPASGAAAEHPRRPVRRVRPGLLRRGTGLRRRRIRRGDVQPARLGQLRGGPRERRSEAPSATRGHGRRAGLPRPCPGHRPGAGRGAGRRDGRLLRRLPDRLDRRPRPPVRRRDRGARLPRPTVVRRLVRHRLVLPALLQHRRTPPRWTPSRPPCWPTG